MASSSEKKRPSAAPPPPRALSVGRFAYSRAAELQSLHSILTARLDGDFRSGRRKRRRTTGHLTARNRRRKQSNANKRVSQGMSEKESGSAPRRVRRRLELQKNPDLGFCETADGTKRLRTHLWYAKRFKMVKRWGFYLPLGLLGRGRNSRAVLKWMRSGSVVHDASYLVPVQLDGPEASLLAILKLVMLPLPSVSSEEPSCSATDGIYYENAMLYHCGSTASRFIAPVSYMWRPCSAEDVTSSEQNYVKHSSVTPSKSECRTSSRQMWVWIHAAAFNEGFDALKFACQELTHQSGISINCCSLEGHIAQLEVMGSKAVEVLQKILHPISESSHTSDQSLQTAFLKAFISKLFKKADLFSYFNNLPERAVVSLTVHDPRTLNSEVTRTTEADCNLATADENVQEAKSTTLVDEHPDKEEPMLSVLASKPEQAEPFLSGSKDLWDCSVKPNRPLDEKTLCMRKHQERLKFYCMDSVNFTEVQDNCVETCSILLLKHSSLMDSNTRWSIVLPLSWMKAFWIPLVSSGACAIGLRERRWIACSNSLPSFPYDFPDCRAYSLFMADEAAASHKAAELRPPAVRPIRFPIPPAWDSVFCTLGNHLEMKGCFRIPENHKDVQDRLDACSPIPTRSEECSSPSYQTNPSFPGYIPRTSIALNYYMQNNQDASLRMFRKLGTDEMDLTDCIYKSRLSWINQSVNNDSPNKLLCFVRASIHAFKEGAFEEGAVVCAPKLSDLSLWASRPVKPESIQVPQSFIKSYFSDQDSGKWELHVPTDPSILESFRWPVGFVTSGFVRGSRKPTALAYCELKLLSLLRKQQSSIEGKTGNEIFVLVRNLNSSAYRRALATIVLEKTENDLEFM